MADQPLAGRRIAVTRERGQSTQLIDGLRALGAEPIACPAIAIAAPADWRPADRALAGLASYDWLIVTSANAARALLGRLAALGRDPAREPSGWRRIKLAAVGPATAAALAQAGLAPDFIPSASLAETLAAELGDVAGRRILFPCGDLARDTLPGGLRARGAAVDAVTVYRTVPDPALGELLPLLRSAPPDAITFTSSSTVRFLFDGLQRAGVAPDAVRALLAPVAVACIGPVTAATAREHGLPVAVEAGDHTSAGLLAALAAYFRGTP